VSAQRRRPNAFCHTVQENDREDEKTLSKKSTIIGIAVVLIIHLGLHSALARVIYVDDSAAGANNGTSWASAYKCLQDALAVSRSGDEVWVAQGTYKPDQHAVETARLGIRVQSSGDREASFALISNVAIRGGYAGVGAPDPNARDIDTYETVLSGDLAGNDANVTDPQALLDEPTRSENSITVVWCEEANESSLLEGFIVTAGVGVDVHFGIGGGIRIMGSRPTIAFCTIQYNSTASYGGGMLIGNASQVNMQHCIFRKNWSGYQGGGVYAEQSNCSLTACTFVQNWAAADGGGMIHRGSTALFTDCVFTQNSAMKNGGGLASRVHSTLINCSFIENNCFGDGGGVSNSNGRIEMIDCLFQSNTCEGDGGGITQDRGGDAVLGNCTFTRNRANLRGGGISASGESGTIALTDCSFLHNTAGDAGGGFQQQEQEVKVDMNDCVFRGNAAASRGGGGIACTGSNITISECHLSENTASDGGGLQQVIQTKPKPSSTESSPLQIVPFKETRLPRMEERSTSGEVNWYNVPLTTIKPNTEALLLQKTYRNHCGPIVSSVTIRLQTRAAAFMWNMAKAQFLKTVYFWPIRQMVLVAVCPLVPRDPR